MPKILHSRRDKNVRLFLGGGNNPGKQTSGRFSTGSAKPLLSLRTRTGVVGLGRADGRFPRPFQSQLQRLQVDTGSKHTAAHSSLGNAKFSTTTSSRGLTLPHPLRVTEHVTDHTFNNSLDRLFDVEAEADSC